jgi:hypothetical protein
MGIPLILEQLAITIDEWKEQGMQEPEMCWIIDV